jgi:Flp pilus assembly protein TadD
MGDLRLAMDDYSRALQLNPKNANALFGRGSVRLATGDKTGAEADKAAAMKLNPKVADVMASLGIKA